MQNNIDDIIGKIKNNSDDENRQLAEELKNNLSPSQTDALNNLISNKDLMSKLLSSDAAKNILNKLGGGENGHK